jgi:cytochrome P450
MQTREQMLRNAASLCEMQNYIIPVLHAREAEPREDMISDLVHARLEDEESPTLSFEEKLSTIRALLIAGNDTTAAALGNLMLILAQQPDLAQRLHENIDDERTMTRFVEEVLRLQPPVHGLFRTNMKEVELSGTTIPAFSQICVLFASANDDEAEFPCPRAIDLDRPNLGRQMSFGAGIHRCIGAALSRMEIKVAAQEVIRRLDDIRLAIPPEDIRYLPTLGTHTLERLPLTFRRRA